MADFEFDTTGTVSVTNGSTAVTGVGTNWLTTYPGLELNIDGLAYPVKSVNSRYSITLVHPFQARPRPARPIRLCRSTRIT